MKKFILALTMMILFFAVNVYAAWTVSISMNSVGGNIYRIKIEAVSDGSDPAEFELDTATLSGYLSENSMKYVRGAILYQVEIVPGVEPDAVWTVSFDTGAGASILDLSGISVTATELWDASRDLGFYPVIDDNIGIDIGDIGSNLDSVTIYLIIFVQ